MNLLSRFRVFPTGSHCRSLHVIKKKYDLDLNENQADKFDNGQKHRKHMGLRHNPCVKLPFNLAFATRSLINKYNNKKFRRDVARIKKEFLDVFIEESSAATPKRTISANPKENETQDLKQSQPKRTKPEPVPIADLYNHHDCVAYMVSRMPANYAALSLIFNEIRHEEPEFVPSTLFDFGSGVGSTIWAADHYWGNKIKEIFCVDLNENMNQVSRELLEKGTFHNDHILDRIFYRQFLPVKHEPTYDLVVSAFSLLDTHNLRSRIFTVENLWKKTSGMLVLVEHGSKAGFQAIMEARNFILQISNQQLEHFKLPEVNVKAVSKQSALGAGSVVAPCPHDLACPRQLVLNHKSYCNFTATYNEIDYGQANPGAKTERFAYVVIKKNESRFNFREEQKLWPRIVEPVVKNHKHTICRLCTNDGLLKEVILSKKKTPPHMYKCARKSSWGDKLPAGVIEAEIRDDNNEEEPTKSVE